MDNFALFLRAKTGTFPEGLTVNEEPMHNRKSQDAAC